MSQPNNEIPSNEGMISEFELEYEKEEEVAESVEKAKDEQPNKHRATRKSSKTWLHFDAYANEKGLLEKNQHDIETLTLATQPLKTSKFFILAVFQYIKQSILYLLAKGGLLLCFTAVIIASGLLLLAIDGPHEKHVDEILKYFWFGLWWLTLGVASSIGLGSGLHTFVLYLGPHIALFTIKAMQCGRIDIKRGIYDTIQLKRGPSWLDTDCSEYGPPQFLTPHGVRVPLSSILPQIQTEAVLWGIGTALGELPPYFISRAAHLSGRDMSTTDAESETSEGYLSRMKCWLLSHAQYLNFFTILFLASVPNPLFDLAGIMCGQFGIPFWKFFTATLLGKAIIKTHIQTVFIISVCNNQLLDWIENELLLALSVVPGLAPLLPDLLLKLHAVKDRYMAVTPPLPSNIKVSRWGLSFSSVWNTLVWLMLVNYFVKIVNSAAQGYFKEQLAVDGRKMLTW